ncbi:tRNA 2-thiouridine(34) synthase MnmA [Demequina sp. SYSU T00039]|uniref:tRNA-specific 2-thiouridylase MnmA n=1 Tax=Demequina lignilytica TaxID=3051663 RepID=A0AAW7M5F8_9MICO|nr:MULTISPECIES: tRNA 2-thiouridine(34) synthase MnmA [unclassified Demequina]MDN4478792.1 tRNA 2-thiouridine(34) synthase MnmA [Demequina sp. SYSU T00039-1]MDN4488890.1 tRNA 2-thiouridine(34) synthase MnmA [Demequina sp. SYSU T00039]
MRVLAALSGGVDSAVAAARAKDAGHDVVGVHMALSRSRAEHREGSRGCCSIEDANDARRAADRLGIPYYVWDLSDEFHDTVVSDFLAEYQAGRTPNPCVRCNEHIKFDTLLERGLALGFDAVCTGHYARIDLREDGARELHRAADAAKDQSYVLAVMGPERLARAMFPLGTVASKAEVRAEAVARGLGVSNKPDSYDICFVADGDTKGFLTRALGERPGEIVDETGAVVGAHEGAYAFTVGQRKGLRLPRPAADGAPRYVTGIDTARNVVTVGPETLLSVRELVGEDVVWLAPDVPCTSATAVEVQVRAHGAPVAGVATRDDARVTVALEEPMRGVAAGQSLVLYRGSRVLGQATIAR